MLRLTTPTGEFFVNADPPNHLGVWVAMEGFVEKLGTVRLVARLTPVQAERAAAELRLVVPTAARAAPLPIVPDPWVHRAERMRCRTCMWYVTKGENNSALGRCRRRAPTMGGYPVVFTSDWCGDHKLDETAPGATPVEPAE